MNNLKNVASSNEYKFLLEKIINVFLVQNKKEKHCDIERFLKTSNKIKEDACCKLKTSNVLYFVESAKDHVLEFIAYYLYLKKTEKRNQALSIYSSTEAELNKVFERIASAEAYLYFKYQGNNKDVPELSKIFYDKSAEDFFTEYNVVELYQNIYLPQFTYNKISEFVYIAPKDQYPRARENPRHFTIHVGGTNTGKTYNSINALKNVEKGVYLAPLRLLAMEIQDTLNNSGVPCSLTTGEEEDIIPGAKHISSTVEKLDTKNKYDLCVIDECQMISDSQRGCHWTRAILGVQAKEVHLCTAPESLKIITKIIKDCGDTYDVVEHFRTTELNFLADEYKLKNAVRGDAIVVFSRKSVLSLASELTRYGISSSVIYGGMPYAARKKQIARFVDKETDVVVATDAIGMGLNLPIRRVIFFETEKFDGTNLRKLNPGEIKQIAGRAGRKGIYDEGFVLSISNKSWISEGLRCSAQDVFTAYLDFSDELLSIDAPLTDILKAWKTIPPPKPYTKTDISRTIALCDRLSLHKIDLDKKTLLKVTSIPFNEKSGKLEDQWLNYCGNIEEKEAEKPALSGRSLEAYEDYYRAIDLYYSFSKNMGYKIDLEWIKNEKTVTTEAINTILVNDIDKQHKKCSCCGKKLPWDYRYKICQECYDYQ